MEIIVWVPLLSPGVRGVGGIEMGKRNDLGHKCECPLVTPAGFGLMPAWVPFITTAFLHCVRWPFKPQFSSV